MTSPEHHLAASSLRWLTGLEIPLDDIEAQLARALGCWAAGTLTGPDLPACLTPRTSPDSWTSPDSRVGARTSRPDPGDVPLRRLLGLPGFDVRRYSGDPVLALALHAALRRRGLRHDSLAELAQVYARVVQTWDSARTRRLGLIRALLASAGLGSPEAGVPDPDGVATGSDLVDAIVSDPEDVEWSLSWVDSREDLLRFCETVAMSTVWSHRPVPTTGLAELVPALAVSYAMEADLEAVCALLRTSAYLGFADQPGCSWARHWLIEQHRDGRFGIGPDDDRPLARTVDALWTLAALRRPGFLLGPASFARDIHTRPTSDAGLTDAGRSSITSAPFQRHVRAVSAPPGRVGPGRLGRK